MAQAMELERLVYELNDSRNQSSPDVIDSIQKRIQRLQREPVAWELGMKLLEHNDAVMRFYGALTLTVKINADWDTDKVGEDRDLVNHLLERLVSSYVRLSSIPDVPFVLQKLCTTLVTFFQKPQSAWALPVRHLTACTIANQYILQNAVPEVATLLDSNAVISGAQLRCLLMFPMTLAEQEGAISGSVKEQSVRVRISNNVPDILRLVHFASISLTQAGAEGSSASSHAARLHVSYDHSQFFDVTRTMLQLVPLWTAEIRAKGTHNSDSNTDTKFGLFEATLKSFPPLFQQDAIAALVLQAFTALEESSHNLLRKALPGYEEHIVRSPQAAAWIEQLVAGDFDPDAVAYMNFLEACMNQVDVTSPEYLTASFYIEILRQVRTLLQCDGAPGVDDTVCQVALEILTSVTEGFSDWPEESPYDDSMRGLVKSACTYAMNKIRIPREELSLKTQTWDADDRAKFQDFRYDVQDYLQNAFSILGDSLVEEITTIAVKPESRSALDLFEAGLFGFNAFSDTLANEPERYDKYVMAVFDCETWHTVINADTEAPDRVRQMVIKVIGENTGFLQRETRFLIPSLNFLFTSLHTASSATAASRAISTLCDAQRSMLTEALPQFMNSLSNTSSIESDAKHRIFAGVGAIIQALPTEPDKVEPLSQILRQLLHHEVDVEVDPATEISDLVIKAVDVLQTIASLGRGLRAPAESPIDLENVVDNNNLFWVDGPGSVVQHLVLRINSTLLGNTNGQTDPVFVEAACNFLRAGFTEEHPSPFKFSNTQTLELLSLYLRLPCPRADHVMSTASSYLASVKPLETDNGFHNLLMMSTRVVNETYLNHKTTGQPLDSDFCTAALDFYTRLLPKWASSFFQLQEAEGIIGLIVETSLLLVHDADTLPRRTAASFFTAFFEASAQPSLNSNEQATATMKAILHSFSPRIIASIVHLLGGVCARSDIDTLAETIKKAVQKQPLIANKLLKEVLKNENAVLTPRALQATSPEQRARFASQIEMLRGQRKTNEVIREFWIACKGREFEYVT